MQFLTTDELKTVLECADADYRLAFLVAYWHGLRATEVISITGANIQDGFLDVKRLKGSLRTRQPLIRHDDPALDEAKLLRKLARETGPRQLLFPWTRFQLNYRFKVAARAAGLPAHKQHPHCLKHSIAMATIGAAGIENVRQWLGHKSISSTGEYLKVSDESAAKAVCAAVGAK